jgi:hypothetical protein
VAGIESEATHHAHMSVVRVLIARHMRRSLQTWETPRKARQCAHDVWAQRLEVRHCPTVNASPSALASSLKR